MRVWAGYALGQTGSRDWRVATRQHSRAFISKSVLFMGFVPRTSYTTVRLCWHSSCSSSIIRNRQWWTSPATHVTLTVCTMCKQTLCVLTVNYVIFKWSKCGAFEMYKGLSAPSALC